MIDIPLDFSALSQLACGRAYQFSCVYGADSSNEASRLGNACHAFFEARNKGSKAAATDILPPLLTKYEIPASHTTKAVLTAMAFDQRPQPPVITDSANQPMAEYKFSIPYATVNDKYRIILCGTMDVVYCHQNDFLVIRDYKTTQALGAAADKIMSSYISSAQLPFYAYAMHKYLHAFLPGNFADMALSLKLAAEFVMVYLSASPVPKMETTPMMSITAETLAAVEELINLSIPRIISIHEYPDIYPPEGSLYKICPKCNFYKICLRSDKQELTKAINNLPKRQYDPTNFR